MSTTASELLTPGPAEALSGLLAVRPPDLNDGEPLPMLWHWVYLLDRPARGDIGADGHRLTGVPTPPGPGRRRMFAGATVTQYHPLLFGDLAERRSWQTASITKQGSSGPLEFVTVRTEISQRGQVCVAEEQDIVYRQAEPADGLRTAPPAASEPPAASTVSPPRAWAIAIDPVVLFQFSALTYNAHRIHYDRDYARGVEGHPELVVHGPLQAILMAEAVRRDVEPPSSAVFTFRLSAPLYVGQGAVVTAEQQDATWRTRVQDSTGRQTATGELAPQ